MLTCNESKLEILSVSDIHVIEKRKRNVEFVAVFSHFYQAKVISIKHI